MTATMRMILAATVAAPLALLAGCAALGMAGAVAESAHQAGSTRYPAEYAGLAGVSYAVVVAADRTAQNEFPALTPSLMQRIDALIASSAGASGHIPGDEVTRYLANHPQWTTWPRSELPKALEVDRVVFVEVNEFRTNLPGNEYVWDGLAWASVSVIEAGGQADATPFRKDIRVKFPDQTNVTSANMDRTAVASVLVKRLTDRVSWLFFEHVEPNSIEY